MKKIIIYTAIFLSILSCEKNNYLLNQNLTAKIVGFDQNCGTCILEFPYDYLQVSKDIGTSPDNYYEAVNLNKGNFRIGQMLRVKIRRTETDEIKPCITLYPSYDYKGLVITNYDKFDYFVPDDTVSLSCQECLSDPENQFYICLDSVLNDSRCPRGAECFWAGNARVRFRFETLNEKPVLFVLNTGMGAVTDTINDEYSFSLINLIPYPELYRKIEQKDYKAEIVIKKIK